MVKDRKKTVITISAISIGFILGYVSYRKLQEKRIKERKENLITLLKDSALGVTVKEYDAIARKVQYPKIKFKDENGNTPFLYACRYGHANLVDYILSKVTTLNYASTVLEKNNEGCNAMHLCTHKGYIDVLKLLFQLEPEYIEYMIKGKTLEAKWTPLHIVSSKGHLECAKLIVNFGVKSIMNEKDSNGYTALIMASCNGYSEIVELLLQHDADPSITVSDGRTPLHYAAHNGRPEIVKIILDARQTPAAELWDDDPLFMLNKSRCSALHESAIMGDLESTKMLVQAGSDINLTSRDGSTPLTSAIMRSHIEIIKYLLEQPNIDILTPTMFGFTPLISAASKSQNDIVQLLLRDKDIVQNLLFRDNDGSTALHHACQSIIKDPIDTIKILLNKAKEIKLEEYVDTVDYSGSTPLLSACWHDSQYLPDIVDVLIEYGADPRKENKYGWCCLHVLLQQNSPRSKTIYKKIEDYIRSKYPDFFDTFSTTIKEQTTEYRQHPLMNKHLQIPLYERLNVLDGDITSKGITNKILNSINTNNPVKIAVLLGDNYMNESDLPTMEDLYTIAEDVDNYILKTKEFNKVVKEKYYPIYKNEKKCTEVHKFIEFLESKGLLKYLFTQNIDMLEFKLNIPKEKIITSHGSFFFPKKCVKCGNTTQNKENDEENYWKNIYEENTPLCVECGGILRPDIKLFGEDIDNKFLSFCEADNLDVDILIVIGLQNEKYPFKQMISNVQRKCARLLINKQNISVFSDSCTNEDIKQTKTEGNGDYSTYESNIEKSKDEMKKEIELGGNYRDVVMVGDINKNIHNLMSQLGWLDQFLEKLNN